MSSRNDSAPTLEPLRVAFISSEVTPYAKTGGLADVSAALPRFLVESGCRVRQFMPLYGSVDLQGKTLEPVKELQEMEADLGGGKISFSVFRTDLCDTGGDLYFIDCPRFYHRSDLYGSEPDEPFRFALLCLGAVEACQRLAWGPDVFHCNDWHTGLLPLYLRTLYAWDRLFSSCKTVLTIHNIAYQGVFDRKILPGIGMAGQERMFHRADAANGVVNFLKTGVLYADAVTTVSETYAREIQTLEFGMGMENVLRERGGTVLGILNGIDETVWSPETDRWIARTFSADDLEGKRVDRDDLLSVLQLKPSPAGPVLGVISRLTPQKGLDLMAGVLPDYLKREDLRLAVLGSGDDRYETWFQRLQEAFPGKVCFYRGFSTELAHKIEAGADIFLMPSRFEPCGLNQMYSMRYGTVPVVRKTGGLADTVRHWNPETGRGTGFVFERCDGEGLRWAVGAALEVFRSREQWRTLMRNGMRKDYSWRTQGRHYLDLYRRLVGDRPIR